MSVLLGDLVELDVLCHHHGDLDVGSEHFEQLTNALSSRLWSKVMRNLAWFGLF